MAFSHFAPFCAFLPFAHVHGSLDLCIILTLFYHFRELLDVLVTVVSVVHLVMWVYLDLQDLMVKLVQLELL